MHSSCRFAHILMLSQILNFFLWVKSDVDLSAMALLHWLGHLTCTELKPIEVDAVCYFGVLCQFKSSPHGINQEANTHFKACSCSFFCFKFCPCLFRLKYTLHIFLLSQDVIGNIEDNLE
jgi:hypothetical protein